MPRKAWSQGTRFQADIDASPHLVIDHDILIDGPGQGTQHGGHFGPVHCQ
jgi:hypothetical protein